MRKIAMLALVLLAACSPTPTAVPLATNPSSLNDLVISTSTVIPQVLLSTVTPQSTVGSVTEISGSLWLQVLSPLDEAVVNTPQVDVTGSAPAGTVVSIDDEILIVGSDQQFKTTVTLDEGPNLIEVIASDENGNEMSVLLTVTYEP